MNFKSFTSVDVKAFRELTGCGIWEAVEWLEYTEGDVEAAVKKYRKRPQDDLIEELYSS